MAVVGEMWGTQANTGPRIENNFKTIYTVDGDFSLGLTAKLAFLSLVQGSPFVSTSWSL